jgi:hypothetical protein
MKPSKLLRKAAPIVRKCEFESRRDCYICNIVERFDNYGDESKRVISHISNSIGDRNTFRNFLSDRLNAMYGWEMRNVGIFPESFAMLQWLRAKWCEDMADYFESIGE